MKKLFFVFLLYSIFANAQYVNQVTGMTNSEIRKKVDLSERLRTLALRVFELEDTLYGRESYDYKGILGDLKICLKENFGKNKENPTTEFIVRLTTAPQDSREILQTSINFLDTTEEKINDDMARFNSYLKKYEEKEKELTEKLSTCVQEVNSLKDLTKELIKNDKIENKEFRIDGFEKYYEAFVKAGKSVNRDVSVKNLIIEFGDPEEAGCSAKEKYSVYGCCSKKSSRAPTVTVSPEKWDKGDETEHERLIFHELGHCILNRSHRDDFNGESQESSVMYPVMERHMNEYYNSHRKEYIKELFKLGPGPEPTEEMTEALKYKKIGLKLN
jgi:hypothetical protein